MQKLNSSAQYLCCIFRPKLMFVKRSPTKQQWYLARRVGFPSFPFALPKWPLQMQMSFAKHFLTQFSRTRQGSQVQQVVLNVDAMNSLFSWSLHYQVIYVEEMLPFSSIAHSRFVWQNWYALKSIGGGKVATRGPKWRLFYFTPCCSTPCWCFPRTATLELSRWAKLYETWPLFINWSALCRHFKTSKDNATLPPFSNFWVHQCAPSGLHYACYWPDS